MTLTLEIRHDVKESTVFLPQKIAPGHSAIIEKQLGCIRRFVPDFLDGFTDGEAFDIGREDEQ